MHGSVAALGVAAAMGVGLVPQPEPVDQGTFRITRDGRPDGTETFTILRQNGPEGATYTLTSTRSGNGETIRTSLRTDAAGGPISYTRQSSGTVTSVLSATGRLTGRLTVNETSGRSRASKEYLVGAGTLLIDNDLFHQMYFVCQSDTPRSISFIAPGSRSSGAAQFAGMGPDEVQLGNGQRVSAMHFSLGAGSARREIWIDSAKRLLEVSVPGQRIDALREDPPR